MSRSSSGDVAIRYLRISWFCGRRHVFIQWPCGALNVFLSGNRIREAFQPNFAEWWRPASTRHELCFGVKSAIYNCLVCWYDEQASTTAVTRLCPDTCQKTNWWKCWNSSMASLVYVFVLCTTGSFFAYDTWWWNVPSGTSSPGLSRTRSREL